MKILPPEVEIELNTDFNSENDLFGRAPLGHGITRLLLSTEDSLVVAIDGPWGSGKSTFLKVWYGSLRANGIPTIYFDAFENDFQEDAFLAIAGQILSLARESGLEKHSTLFEKTKLVTMLVAKSAANVAVRAGTGGLIDAAGFGRAVSQDFATEASSIADKMVDEAIGVQTRQKSVFEQFRKSLSDLVGLFPVGVENFDGDANQSRPLIIIIDEMDRCRPDFALQLLEKIKHFFSTENVHFVIGAHFEQLENSVRVKYGENIDARMYLQKFIHVNINIVDEIHADDERFTERYIYYLKRKMNFPDTDQAKSVLQFLIGIVGRRSISLRSVNRIMTVMTLSLTLIGGRRELLPEIFSGLCYLRAMEPPLYRKAKEGRLTYEDVEVAFGFGISYYGDDHQREMFVMHRNLWRLVLVPDVDRNIINKYSEYIPPGWRSMRLSIVRHVANNVVDFMG